MIKKVASIAIILLLLLTVVLLTKPESEVYKAQKKSTAVNTNLPMEIVTDKETKKSNQEKEIEETEQKPAELTSNTEDDFEKAKNTSESTYDVSTNQTSVEAQFLFEKVDYNWSAYWKNELSTLVSISGTGYQLKDVDVECKSETCKLGIKLGDMGPENTSMALMSLSKEFTQKGLKLLPVTINDPDTGGMIFYSQPGKIR